VRKRRRRGKKNTQIKGRGMKNYEVADIQASSDSRGKKRGKQKNFAPAKLRTGKEGKKKKKRGRGKKKNTMRKETAPPNHNRKLRSQEREEGREKGH